jgi:hypothetical protein
MYLISIQLSPIGLFIWNTLSLETHTVNCKRYSCYVTYGEYLHIHYAINPDSPQMMEGLTMEGTTIKHMPIDLSPYSILDSENTVGPNSDN